MQGVSLTTLVNEQLEVARRASSGRSSQTIHSGRTHPLRQTLIVLAAGRALDDHDSPPEATLQVLQGHVRLATKEDAEEDTWEGRAGDFLILPAARHNLEAIDESAVLLTVANRLEP
jgi:quercetin dioxygenase-like cupin family protein